MHIYDHRFPVAPNAKLRPADATVDDYRLLQKRIGTTRNVVVTPSTYGTDNSVTLDAIAKLGAAARGVAVVDASVSDAELKRLDGLGITGIRFNLVQSGATTIEMLEPLSKRVDALGWHVQIHMLGDQILQTQDLLQRLPSRIVFDHLARIPQLAGVDHPAFAFVQKLIDKGRTWVKLSSAYQDSKVGPPTYADVSKVAQAYVKAAPEQMVGAATGRIRPKRPTPNRTTRSCSTSWPTGRPMRPSATASGGVVSIRTGGLTAEQGSLGWPA